METIPKDIDSLIYLASTNKTINNILKDTYVREQIAILYEIPSFFILSEAKKYTTMGFNDRLVEATKMADLKSVIRMIDAGADNLDYAMEIAAKEGNIDMVTYFLGKGATSYNNTIARAAEVNRIDIIDLVVEYATIYNTSNYSNSSDSMPELEEYTQEELYNTALLHASIKGNIELVKEIITRGVTFNGIEIALSTAAEHGYMDLFLFLFELVENKINSDNLPIFALENYYYQNALVLATKNNHTEIAKILLKKKLESFDYGNILFYAVNNGNIELVEIILQQPIYDIGRLKQAIINIAKEKGYDEMLSLLQNYQIW